MRLTQSGRQARAAVLWRYWFATGFLVLLNQVAYLPALSFPDVLTALYAAAAVLTGSLLLLVLASLPVIGLHVLMPAPDPASGIRMHDRAVYATSIGLLTTAQGFLVLDRHVYGIYGFHLNGFVWNLVTTKGGIASMGAGLSTKATFAAIWIVIAVIQTVVLVAILRVVRLRTFGQGHMTRRRIGLVVAFLLMVIGFEKTTYALSVFRGYAPVLKASNAFPLYIPVSFSSFLRKLGFSDNREDFIRLDPDAARMNYPLRSLDREPGVKPLNVVWLVAESWRADMLDPDIMPSTWAFSKRASRFAQHYSGGNGTRMGVYSMFYGLTGNYYDACMSELRSPVVMDVMQELGYQLFIYTSAAFSSPELDKTVFARVPRNLLHEGGNSPGWMRDRENVDRILVDIDDRDVTKPFFTFMFFESPHAPYNFPDDCAIRKPYIADMNYLTMDLKKDIGLIKNRYVNSCRHLDLQLSRLLRRFEDRGLLDSTLIVLTGDHGEEFLEKGRWGHHSAFTEEQVRVPLVLYVPGVAPGVVDRMTSHLDLPATVLHRLGVRNPAEDYSLGRDLLSEETRRYAILSGWAEIAYVDARFKSVFPFKSYHAVRHTATTRDDAPASAKAFVESCHGQLLEMMKDLKRFQK